MEEKLIELLKTLNKLNDLQSNLFGEMNYTADDSKNLEIAIRQKKSYKYLERCNVSLTYYPVEKLDAIISIFNKYAGGTSYE